MYFNVIQQKWQFLHEVSFLIVRLIHSFHSCNSSQASQLWFVSPRSHIRYLNLKFYTISCSLPNLTQTYPATRTPKPPSTYTYRGPRAFCFSSFVKQNLSSKTDNQKSDWCHLHQPKNRTFWSADFNWLFSMKRGRKESIQ